MPKSLVNSLITFLLPILAFPVAGAPTLCVPVATQEISEGLWPIPEDAFTEERARNEIEKLKRLLDPDGVEVDSVAWETSFVYIEGWYLKRQAIEAKKRSDNGLLLSDFCTFIKERAYVHH
jgi:hypothetical protein